MLKINKNTKNKQKMKKLTLALITILTSLNLFSQSFFEISWPAATNSNINAYNLYLGTKSGTNSIVFDKKIQIHGLNNTNYTLYNTNLYYGQTNYVGVSALNTNIYLAATNSSFNSNNVTLAWTSSPDTNIVVGYKMYYGIINNTTNIINVGNTLITTISNLISGSNYFFFATAYDTNNVESEPSNMIFYEVGLNNVISSIFIAESTIVEMARIYISPPIIGLIIKTYLESSTNLITWTNEAYLGEYVINIDAANKTFRTKLTIERPPQP